MLIERAQRISPLYQSRKVHKSKPTNLFKRDTQSSMENTKSKSILEPSTRLALKIFMQTNNTLNALRHY